jgi:deoxyribonuclease-4
MGRLVLVRHGESEGNRDRIFTPTPDVPLTEAGRAQVSAAAAWIATRFRPVRIVASPFTRARQSAEILAATFGLGVDVEEDLRERSYGALAGRPYAVVRDCPDYDPEVYWEWCPPEGGETLVAVARRAGAVLDRLVRTAPREDVVVVSHGALMMGLWWHVTGVWRRGRVARTVATWARARSRTEVHGALHLDPPLADIPTVLAAPGLRHFQTTLRNPQRFGNSDVPSPEDRTAYRAAAATVDPPLWGIVHASLLTNLASPEGRIRNASVSSLLGDLQLARELDLAGVCFHAGYARGHPDREAAMAQAVRKLIALLERAPDGPRAVLENTCEGTELGVDLAEVARLVRDTGAPAARLGVLVDTCHLHAAGFDLSGPRAGDTLAAALDHHGLLDRLVAFHLNDCRGPAGCRRDRHATPGEGSIGEGLISIGRHPAFREVPAILEVPVEDARRGLAYLAREGALP